MTRFAQSPAVACLLLLTLIALYLIPIWRPAHFPSEDGPEHLYNVVILREYHWPGREPFRRWFQPNHRLVPNWTTALLLDGLLCLFDPVKADKMLVSIYLLSYFLAALYAVRGFKPGAAYQSLLLLPLALNVFVFLGFENFYFSVPVLLLILGYWRRRSGRLGWKETIVLSALSLLLYFCHLVTFGVEGIFFLLIAAARLRGGINRRHLRQAAAPLLAMIPGVALAIWFLATSAAPPGHRRLSLADRASGFFTWGQIFQRSDGYLSSDLTKILLLLTAFNIAPRFYRRRWRQDDALLAAAVLLAVTDLFVPDGIGGGGFMVRRLNLLPLLLWMLWLAIQPARFRGWSAFYAAAAVYSLLMLASLTQSVSVLDGYVTEYLSAERAVHFGGTFLPVANTYVGYTPTGQPLTEEAFFAAHLAGWVALDRRAVEVTDYEAATDYFPIRFRPAMAPPTARPILPSQYAQEIPGHQPIDQVLLWAGGSPPWASAQPLIDDIHKHYRLVYRSPGRGYIEVYDRIVGP